MLTTALNDDGFTGSILIEPNRPIDWSTNLRFIKVFALLSLAIGLFFMSQGFLLILPFSGLEVLALGLSLFIVYRRYTICQVVYFTNNSIIIESGNQHPDNRIEYQRHWSAFHIDNQGNYRIPRLRIRCQGKSTEIGAFLNSEDKAELISLVKQLTQRFISD
jgi:uncharacterized membrane protein